MNEVIEGIELVKMYSWEMQLYTFIIQKRKQEVESLTKIYIFLSYVRGFFESSVIISILSILTPYILFTENSI